MDGAPGPGVAGPRCDGSVPGGPVGVGPPPRSGGFEDVAIVSGPGPTSQAPPVAREGSRQASSDHPNTLASVSKATSSIHNTTERQTRPTML